MIEPKAFRAAMARLGAAVNIITTTGPAGRMGMTASAVCSVSDDPASLLLCVNRNARISPALAENGQLCVNVLAADQTGISGVFANSALEMDARFAAAEWDEIWGGVRLEGALASFGCEIVSSFDVGSHTIFICHVRELVLGGGGAGLVYFDRDYHHLPFRAPEG